MIMTPMSLTVDELLRELEARGVVLTLEGHDIRVKAPLGAITPELRDRMQAHKMALIEYLRSAPDKDRFGTRPGAIPVVARTDHLPLSYAQQRLWFLDQLTPGSALHNMPALLQLEGVLDVAALRCSLEQIAERHEALRTTLPAYDGVPAQRIHSPGAWLLPVLDLGDLPAAERDAELARVSAGEACRPFDLAAGPLMRTTLVRLGEQTHVLLLTVHHIVSDGWSMGILLHELCAHYDAISRGSPVTLPQLPVQYADYAVWQRQWLDAGTLEQQLAYWRGQLANVPVLDMPTDRPRPATPTLRGARAQVTVSGEVAERLKALAGQEGATLFMVLLAAFQVFLGRHSGQNDVAVGAPIAGRTRPELAGLIGFFVNTLVLRTDLGGNPSFRELLRRVRQVALEAYQHQDVPFEKLVEELAPDRASGRTPLFQALFALQTPPPAMVRAGELVIRPRENEIGVAKFDLSLFLEESAHGISGYLEYDIDLFEATTAGRMAKRLETLLEGIAEDCDRPVAMLPLLSAAEHRMVLVEWNATGAAYSPDACVHDLFMARARATPEAVAVILDNRALTYRELDEQSNRLAWHLCSLGVRPETRVGLFMERSPDMLVAVLGTLKAGGAYVPLDPHYPQQRLEHMLADSGAPLLLTQSHLLPRLPVEHIRAVCLDDDSIPVVPADAPPKPDTNPANLCYVIYTSGSTGKPKGVAISHAAVANFMGAMAPITAMSPADVLVAVTSISFDIAALELMLPLLHGARVILASRDIAMDGHALAACLRTNGATVMQATPATWQMLVNSGFVPPAGLRVLCGGESLPPALAKALCERGAPVVNVYGPTETTIWSTAWPVDPHGSPIRIGTPIAATRTYVLDPWLQPVPPKTFGELYIAGAGVARGYLEKSGLTAERFVPDPFAVAPGARMYRTGDQARWLDDGTLEFLGRRDHQVKVRGFRIELGEIEAVMGEHPSVARAVALVREDRGGKEIVAYVVARPSSRIPPAPTALREHLSARVPPYMVPSAFVLLDELPLTPNGKVDRKALPAPDAQAQLGDQRDYVAPRTDTERALAQIWSEVLGVERPGISDDFFALGGHSLLATRLVALIERRLGQSLPLRAVFENPTIMTLAARIDDFRTAANQKSSSLVALQAGGKKPALACVHAITGLITQYRPLSAALGQEQPFYCLQAAGIERDENPLRNVSDMARRYIHEIREVMPDGPYRLCGWSFGGLIAFEMARQLVVDYGRQVALLALIDTPTPQQQPTMPEGEIFHVLASHAGMMGVEVSSAVLRQLGVEASYQYIAERLFKGTSPGSEQAQRVLAVCQASMEAYSGYRVNNMYSGRITLLRAQDAVEPMDGEVEGLSMNHEPDYGWHKYSTEPVTVCTVAGNHYTMLGEPHVQGLAKVLSDLIMKTA